MLLRLSTIILGYCCQYWFWSIIRRFFSQTFDIKHYNFALKLSSAVVFFFVFRTAKSLSGWNDFSWFFVIVISLVYSYICLNFEACSLMWCLRSVSLFSTFLFFWFVVVVVPFSLFCCCFWSNDLHWVTGMIHDPLLTLLAAIHFCLHRVMVHSLRSHSFWMCISCCCFWCVLWFLVVACNRSVLVAITASGLPFLVFGFLYPFSYLQHSVIYKQHKEYQVNISSRTR